MKTNYIEIMAQHQKEHFDLPISKDFCASESHYDLEKWPCVTYQLAKKGLEQQQALQNIVNVLGPNHICECPPNGDCGLREEATEALRLAEAELSKNED